MSRSPFAMRDTSLDRAARRILRILEAEEVAKRASGSVESGFPVRRRAARSEAMNVRAPSNEWESAQVTIPIGPRIGPFPLRTPMPQPAPPLIDPVPPFPVPNPDARRIRDKKKHCVDLYEKCQNHGWWTAPGWRCENCMKYCIANNGIWPYDNCSPLVADADEHAPRKKSCGGNCSG